LLLETSCRYFSKHEERMCYDEYLCEGYPIASGVIEGACRHVAKDRLERTGMSWKRAGAQVMPNHRTIWTCDQWDEFDNYPVERETARLNPYRESLNTPEWPVAA
jgi:hypothetical protein